VSGAAHERLQPSSRWSRLSGSTEPKVHRHTVLHDAILVEDLVQHVQRTTAINHEVLGDDFEPVNGGLFVERMWL
jgi:hypothetical protein